jgi:hypothetical protein
LASPDHLLTTATFDVVSGVGSCPIVPWATIDVILAVVYRTDVVIPCSTHHLVGASATAYGVVATEATDVVSPGGAHKVVIAIIAVDDRSQGYASKHQDNHANEREEDTCPFHALPPLPNAPLQ